MKRLLAASLIVASISLAYAQTATFDIAKSAAATAKEAKITCKKLAVAPKNCVIAYFDEDFEVSKKPSEFYRVLNGKTADGQFIATDYYSSGQLQADPFTTRNRQALLTSGSTEELGITAKAYTTYDEDGNKVDATDLIDGIANGLRTEWYDTGSKITEAVYKGGSKNGSYQYWNKNGSKRAAGDYTDGNVCSEWTTWHDNGKIEAKVSYDKDGLETGEWHYWYENGEKEAQGAFDGEEQRHGTWTEWDESGKVIHTSVYANGALISVDGVAVSAGAAAADAAKAAMRK